jgi:chorismate mutase/prephenate dehydratase
LINAFSTCHGSVAYLGPAGSWTHQATSELFPQGELLAMSLDELVKAYEAGTVEFVCLPVTTSQAGATPYLDVVLNMRNVAIVAEYPKMLGYSLLVKPGTALQEIREVFAHPVAFEEVRPWLAREMSWVQCTNAATGGAAAEAVVLSATHDKASFGPMAGAGIYGLEALASGIEEGPHNVTRWWVLGRVCPGPTGHDKTSMVARLADAEFGEFVGSIARAGLRLLTIYERPAKTTLNEHKYLFEIEGHELDHSVRRFCQNDTRVRVLGSYHRAY